MYMGYSIMLDLPMLMGEEYEGSKWDITEPTKIEGKPSTFGTSCHVILPRAWLKKTVITVTKETWDGKKEEGDESE